MVSRYTGVDMSAAAIHIARDNIRRAVRGGGTTPSTAAAAAAAAAAGGDGGEEEEGVVIEFVEGDMLAFARGCEAGAYDLVFASLAIHHLPEDQKAELVGRIGGRVLAPGGAFVLVDIFLNPGGRGFDLGLGGRAVCSSQPAAGGRPAAVVGGVWLPRPLVCCTLGQPATGSVACASSPTNRTHLMMT
jgi:SAM-dependent methyltransferase